MEKTNAAIIAEIKEAISSLRRELDNIENRLTELDFTEPVETELIVEEPEVNDEPVVEDMPEIEPFDIMLDADPQIEPELQSEPLPELQSEPLPELQSEPLPELQSEPLPEPQPEPQPEQALEPEPEPLLQPDPLPEPEPELKSEPELEPQPQPDEPKKTIFESIMPDTMPWKRDIPGSPVQNILSAISLNDRVLFINTLFEGDPLHFQDTMRIFNQSSSLAEIEHYIVENFPKWNMNSDVVYRFMMAVRRKINQ